MCTNNRMRFLLENPTSIPLYEKKVEKFRGKVSENRLVKLWLNASELPGLVALSLSKTIKVYPAVGWVRASNIASGELLADLNDLRKENAQLKAAVIEFESRFVPEDTDLAPLDDSFSVRLKWTEHSHQILQHCAEEVIVTWKEIFGRIAPDLQEYPNDTSVSFKLGASLYRKQHYGADIAVQVQHDDFQTIRVQLTALKLINTKHQKTTKGNMALFWSLTKKGQQLMTQLRTVKATTKRSVADTS